MAKRSFPLHKVYTLLEPGPVVLLTTAGKGGPGDEAEELRYTCKIPREPAPLRVGVCGALGRMGQMLVRTEPPTPASLVTEAIRRWSRTRSSR